MLHICFSLFLKMNWPISKLLKALFSHYLSFIFFFLFACMFNNSNKLLSFCERMFNTIANKLHYLKIIYCVCVSVSYWYIYKENCYVYEILQVFFFKSISPLICYLKIPKIYLIHRIWVQLSIIRKLIFKNSMCIKTLQRLNVHQNLEQSKKCAQLNDQTIIFTSYW